MVDRPRPRGPFQVFSAAAELLLKCVGYMRDVESSAGRAVGQRTYYAVDADVVTMYLEPDRGFEYGDALGEGKESASARDLTFLIGDFLFARRDSLIPDPAEDRSRLLLVRPHEIEVLGQVSSIYERLVEQSYSAETGGWDALSEAFRAFEKSGDSRALSDDLRRLVPDLVELYDPYRGPRAALTRFAGIIPTNLTPLASARNRLTIPILDGVHNRDDRVIGTRLIFAWRSLLSKHTRADRTHSIRTDAQVLAVVEHANQSMLARDQELVLITGSRYLFDAAEEYRPPWHPSGRSFAELYLRHPQAFLAHPRFFAHAGDDKVHFAVRDWLNLLFPTAVQSLADSDIADVRKVRRGLASYYRDVVTEVRRAGGASELLAQWRAQISALAEARFADGLVEERAAQSGAKELAATLRQLRVTRQWSPASLRRLLVDEALQAISKLYETTVLVGLWTEADRVDARGVPAIRFRSPRRIYRQYRDAVVNSQTSRFSGGVPRDVVDRLLNLNHGVVTSDPSLYYAHVIHALAFAAKGHWHATLTLAGIAIAIANRLDQGPGEYRTGREAAYLACVAARRAAMDPGDRGWLDVARGHLDYAVERDTFATQRDIRFRVEEVALAERTLEYDYLVDGQAFDGQAAMRVLEQFGDVLDSVRDERNAAVKDWVLRQTLATFLLLLSIVQAIGPTEATTWHPKARQYTRDLRRLLGRDEDRRRFSRLDDPWAYLVCDLWDYLLSTDADRGEVASSSIRATVDQWNGQGGTLGRKRLELFRELVGVPTNGS